MASSEKIPATEIAKRSWSEGMWMYLFHDSELQRGKKNVLVVLAPDRTHPVYQAMHESFTEVEKELDEIHNVRIFFEDHPGSFLHEKFNLGAQDFQWFLIDIRGNLLEHSDRNISVLSILNRLKASALNSEDLTRFESAY